jgi:hypothetical protein
VYELTAQVLPKVGGGQIKFSGYADTAHRVSEMEDSLRDDRHSVSGKGLNVDLQSEYLPWTFDETLFVAPPGETAKTAATKAAAKSTAARSVPASAAKGGAK